MSQRRLAETLAGESVVITATEFAATQIDTVFALAFGEPRVRDAGTAAGMNEATPPGHANRIMRLSLALWSWNRALDLLIELESRGARVAGLSLIVNDLVVAPALREAARRLLVHALPGALTDGLAARHLKYVEPTPAATPRLRFGNRVIPIDFAFESHLRNRARKLIDSLQRTGLLEARDGDVRVRVDRSRLRFKAAPDFAVNDGDEVRLERHGRTPLGPAFLLAHYVSHGRATSVNVADFENKCAYRSGAVARHALDPDAPPVHNLFYYSESDDDCVHETFASGRVVAGSRP